MKLPCWNFYKANWTKLKEESANLCTNLPFPEIDINRSYSEFSKRLIKLAKKCIPRGYCNSYIPYRNTTCKELADADSKANNIAEKQEKADDLINYLNQRCETAWI